MRIPAFGIRGGGPPDEREDIECGVHLRHSLLRIGANIQHLPL